MATQTAAYDDQPDPPDDAFVTDEDYAWNTNVLFGPEIRRIYRDVVADRFQNADMPPHAAPLFDVNFGPYRNDRDFLGDFYNSILHQDTCNQFTADGVPLLAALAVDDRVPARHRMELVEILFSIATVPDRRLAECWPQTPPHADPDGEARATATAEQQAPQLLARWDTECAAVRLALTAVAVVFPTQRTLPALTPRLQGFIAQHPAGTDIGDYVRFALVLAADDADAVHASVETLTDTHWKATPRAAPTRARALHLLDQMLFKVKRELATQNR
ncbi:hypothetical protein GCM10009839_18080 [Catenulispora yoronensis]|uniref:Uncharacterized protein n=1 Tax=Catenulispora yoronensis TaxID=450799 RepID=A0ABP5FD39_9ACTN